MAKQSSSAMLFADRMGLELTLVQAHENLELAILFFY